MKTYVYQNNKNLNKVIEVRRYDCGHYVWKQFIYAPTFDTRNYTGCSLKRCHIGTWHRVTRKTILSVLEDYHCTFSSSSKED